MFNNYFGHYLLEKGELTREQFLTIKEAQTWNGTEIGSYPEFSRIVLEQGIMTQEQLDCKLAEFKEFNQYTNEEMDALESGSIESIVPLFMKAPGLESIHAEYIQAMLCSLLQFVDTDIRMCEVSTLSPIQADCSLKQEIYGDQVMFTVLAGSSSVLLDVASAFGREDFKQIDTDSLDSIGEFMNVCNGRFVSAQSEEGIEFELCPPVFYPDEQIISSEGVAYILPVYISDEKVNVVFSVNTDIQIA